MEQSILHCVRYILCLCHKTLIKKTKKQLEALENRLTYCYGVSTGICPLQKCTSESVQSAALPSITAAVNWRCHNNGSFQQLCSKWSWTRQHRWERVEHQVAIGLVASLGESFFGGGSWWFVYWTGRIKFSLIKGNLQDWAQFPSPMTHEISFYRSHQ